MKYSDETVIERYLWNILHETVIERYLWNILQEKNSWDILISCKQLLAIKIKPQWYMRWEIHCITFPSIKADQIKKDRCLLAADSNNEEGIVKVNPLLVRLFDNDLGCEIDHLLDMCCSLSGTAEILLENISNALRNSKIDLSNCVRRSLDNTSINLDWHNSIITRVQKVNNVALIIMFTTRQIKMLKSLCWKVVLIVRTYLLIYSISLIKAQKDKSI